MSGIHGNGVTLLCYEICGRVQHFGKDMISRATETCQCRQEGMLGGTKKSNRWNGDRGLLRSVGTDRALMPRESFPGSDVTTIWKIV